MRSYLVYQTLNDIFSVVVGLNIKFGGNEVGQVKRLVRGQCHLFCLVAAEVAMPYPWVGGIEGG
jgi:hypothetical protein